MDRAGRGARGNTLRRHDPRPHRRRPRHHHAAQCPALALLVGGLALAVFLTRDEDGIQVDNLLSEDFTREVASADANGTDLDLAEIAPFEWSRVLVIQPGTPDVTHLGPGAIEIGPPRNPGV